MTGIIRNCYISVMAKVKKKITTLDRRIVRPWKYRGAELEIKELWTSLNDLRAAHGQLEQFVARFGKVLDAAEKGIPLLNLNVAPAVASTSTPAPIAVVPPSTPAPAPVAPPPAPTPAPTPVAVDPRVSALVQAFNALQSTLAVLIAPQPPADNSVPPPPTPPPGFGPSPVPPPAPAATGAPSGHSTWTPFGAR